MKKRLNWKLIRSESGVSLVLVALAMVALLGFTALVIDGGRLYSEKSKMQKALDAAVLAGAQELRLDDGGVQAEAIARQISLKNGYSLTEAGELNVDLTSVDGEYSIKAKKQVSVPMTFARVLGISEVDVGAKAKAIVAPLKKGYRIAPIAIAEDSVPGTTELTFDNPGDHHGNAGFLDLNGKGAGGLADGIINGGTFEIGTEVVESKTGLDYGPVREAIQALIDSDASKDQCQSAATADNSCSRVITIVIIKTWEDANGKSDLEVKGLAAYWIEKMEGKKIIGHFIREVAPGEIGEGSDIGDYNLYGVKLVE